MGLLTVISDQLNYTDDAYARLHGTWKEQQVRSIETLTSLPSWNQPVVVGGQEKKLQIHIGGLKSLLLYM